MTQDLVRNDLVIVIVTYNSATEICTCLEAALQVGAEIIVVDNASQDGTVDTVRPYPVHLIANHENQGFSGAVNQAIRQTQAEFVLLLNPDAVISSPLDVLLDLCRNPETGAAAGVLTDLSGQPQIGFSVRRLPSPLSLGFESIGINRLFPRNPVNWRFRCFDLSLDGSRPLAVEQPAGAFLMFRRATWELLEGFDERFHPLWFEDVDFCARLKLRNLGIFLAPNVIAKHTGSHSILNMSREIRAKYWYGNLLRYASKHFSARGRKLVSVSVFLGAGLRYLGNLLSHQNESARRTIWKDVAQLAVRSFLGEPI